MIFKVLWHLAKNVKNQLNLHFKNLFSTFERKVSDIYIIVHGVFILIQQVLLYFSRRFWSHLNQDIGQCDCLIIFGTFLAVAPFNGLVVVAKPQHGTLRVFISKTKPGSVGFAGWIMGLGRNR